MNFFSITNTKYLQVKLYFIFQVKEQNSSHEEFFPSYIQNTSRIKLYFVFQIQKQIFTIKIVFFFFTTVKTTPNENVFCFTNKKFKKIFTMLSIFSTNLLQVNCILLIFTFTIGRIFTIKIHEVSRWRCIFFPIERNIPYYEVYNIFQDRKNTWRKLYTIHVLCYTCYDHAHNAMKVSHIYP